MGCAVASSWLLAKPLPTGEVARSSAALSWRWRRAGPGFPSGRLYRVSGLSSRVAASCLRPVGRFGAPGAPADVPLSCEIVPPINPLSRELRKLDCPVIFVVHANTAKDGRSDWELFFNHVVGDDARERTKQVLAARQKRPFKTSLTTFLARWWRSTGG